MTDLSSNFPHQNIELSNEIIASYRSRLDEAHRVAVQSSIDMMRNNTIFLSVTDTISTSETISTIAAEVPGLLLQAVITPGEPTKEGVLVEAVALPWYEIVQLLVKDPRFMYEMDWRKWEEVIAGAYKRQGFEVILTPRSHDGGRDI